MIRFWGGGIILICISLFTGGCRQISTELPSVSLPVDIKTNAIDLEVDTMITSEAFIHAKMYYVYKDSTLIVINQATETVPYLEVRNLTDNWKIGNYIPLGKGPGEMLRVVAYLEGNTLKVNDFVKKQIAFVNLDSLLKNPNGYQISSCNYQVLTNAINRFSDGKLLFENPYCFSDSKSGIENKNAPRLKIGDNTTNDEDFGTYDYVTHNVSQGRLVYNQNRNRIVYASSSIPVVEIYDSTLAPLMRIVGPDSFDDQMYVIAPDGLVTYKKTAPYAYLTYSYDDDYFYLVYNGELIDFNVKQEKDLHTWIFRFDWDGNFEGSYYYPGYVNAISISGDGKSFYASARDEDNMPMLVKLSGIE
ncbi:BF3164 family lipoprotein [uncultured Rikenella sp.]|uniref:BF3164 family lipoprotein n=1 Tax=uncultured Rikenella sp. TaxID=368003 RepID=UPI002620B743|nr:BF3164 family lipoprotein [uncultured Rikenella sp.]